MEKYFQNKKQNKKKACDLFCGDKSKMQKAKKVQLFSRGRKLDWIINRNMFALHFYQVSHAKNKKTNSIKIFPPDPELQNIQTGSGARYEGDV